MAKATVRPDHQLISSADVVAGTNLYGAGGKNIGGVDHPLIDKVSGRVAYAVIGFGGFLGLGHGHYPMPWSAVQYDTKLAGYVTGITEEQPRDASAFGDRDVEAEIHRHFGAAYYWEMGTRG